MTEPQVIKVDGKPAFVLVPWAEWQWVRRMLADSKLSDEELADRAMARIDAGEETYPSALVDRLLADESAVKVFREHRGLTQAALAAMAGIGAPYLAQIEQGVRRGSLKTLRRLATALSVDLDFLLPRDPQR